MRWDFDDGDIPVPSDERVAYLRLSGDTSTTHVEVHQLVADQHEADFMRIAWSMVLGRLHQSFGTAAISPNRAITSGVPCTT